MTAKKLTAKQARFVEEYLIDLNATQAAIRAGYSKKSAGRFSQELLTKTHIAEAIEKAQAKRSERTEITQDMVIEGLLAEAKLEGEGSSHSARVNAWTQLGKHLKMFTDKQEHTGKDGADLFPQIQVSYE